VKRLPDAANAADVSLRQDTTFDSFWIEASRQRGACIIEDAQTMRVETSGRKTTYYFTKRTHPAYPSVVWRSLVRREDGFYVDTEGHCFDSKKQLAFDHWVSSLSKLNAALRAEL